MNRAGLIDAAERTAATFLEAFLAVVIVQGLSPDALAVAATAGGLAVAKWGSVHVRAWRRHRGDD